MLTGWHKTYLHFQFEIRVELPPMRTKKRTKTLCYIRHAPKTPAARWCTVYSARFEIEGFQSQNNYMAARPFQFSIFLMSMK